MAKATRKLRKQKKSKETAVLKPGRTAWTPTATQAPAANTNAVLTLPAPTTGSWILDGSLRWSYDGGGTLAGGLITIAWNDGSAQSETYGVTSSGPGFMPFNNRKFPAGVAVTITLAQGGAGVKGTIYADARIGN